MTLPIPAVVLGGGISGLVCAYALRKFGIDAQVFEGSARPGGVIHSVHQDGFLLELGPQSFSGTPLLRTLCDELGIASGLQEAPPEAPRFVLSGNTLCAVPLSPPAFLACPLFDLKTKWSIACDLLGNTRPPQQDESIADFVRRKFSGQLLDRLVGPLVSGIYAGDPERLSLRSAFPQLYEAEQSSGSILRGIVRGAKPGAAKRTRSSLFSFREGNETLIRALSASLGTALHCGVKVLALEAATVAGAGYQVIVGGAARAQAIVATRLILATPPDVTGQLLGSLQPAFESLLSAVEFAPLAVVSLGYRRAAVGNGLHGFGFLVPRSAGLRLLGSVWNSSLFPHRAPQDHVLLTGFLGGTTDPAAVSVSPAGLVALMHRELTPLLAISESPVFSNVEIYSRALPQYNLGHAARLAALEKLRSPNLWLAGNYLRGPSLGACVEQSLAIAETVALSARQSRP